MEEHEKDKNGRGTKGTQMDWALSIKQSDKNIPGLSRLKKQDLIMRKLSVILQN